MRFISLVILAGAVAAAPSSKRDLASIQKAITNVQTALGSLDTAVKALSSDPNTAAPILTASTGVQGAIKQATTDITASAVLSLNDALSLQNVATGLTTSVQTTVTDLTAKKAVLDQLGVTSVAVQSLTQQKTDSAALGKAIVSKVPAIGQSIAQQSIDKINAAIDGGIKALSASGNATAASGGNATKAAGKPAARALPVPVSVF